MNKMDDFCVFILTHGRPNKVFTYKTLLERNYTGKVFFVVDDEDKTKDEYIANFGNKVLLFSKAEIVKLFDEGDNFGDRRAIIYARNVCFELAKQVDCKYFIQLDDDYTDFRWSFDNNRKYVTSKYIQNLDKIFSILLKFYKCSNVTTISMAQGGDFIGGAGSGLSKTFLSGQISRKCMNSFICSTDRPFRFMGRINEDVNTYCNLGNKGHLLFTIAQLRLEQKQTQSNSGGMTELYLNSGTYVKSFYSVMYNPSSVKIRQMGQSNKRLHHSINWETTVPKIISEKFKKDGRTQAQMCSKAVA
jgi:hypothetical protein